MYTVAYPFSSADGSAGRHANAGIELFRLRGGCRQLCDHLGRHPDAGNIVIQVLRHPLALQNHDACQYLCAHFFRMGHKYVEHSYIINRLRLEVLSAGLDFFCKFYELRFERICLRVTTAPV